MRPTIDTDAYEDNTHREPPMIFLAGPIKHWWTCWDSPEHKSYVQRRKDIRGRLIHAGYLTYAPWDAIKGTWNPRAQMINDVAIAQSDLMLVLTPPGIPADGTMEEIRYAEKVGTPVHWTTNLGLSEIVEGVERMVGKGEYYV